LKEIMTHFSFLTTSGEEDESHKLKELLLAREILELGTLLSVKMHDLVSFNRHIAQVKTYYNDTGKIQFPPSQRQFPILGLNLLHLLADNRLAEFHTELELIPVDDHNNIYIKHPIQLEQYLMEGAYNKLYASRADVPTETSTFFMDILMNTVRDEIAECSEKAYKSLPLKDAQKILFLASTQELIEYAQKRNWEIGETLVFKTDQKAQVDIPADKLIFQTLTYAKELERIV